MKAIVLVLLIAGPAAADPLTFRTEAGPSAYPAIAASSTACEADPQTAHAQRSKVARIDGTEVHILHGCGTTDEDAVLGRFDDGSPAIVYRR